LICQLPEPEPEPELEPEAEPEEDMVSIDDIDAILAGNEVAITDAIVQEDVNNGAVPDEIDAILAGVDIDIADDSIEDEEGIDLSDTDEDEEDNSLKKS
jgi:hypothetical protein